MSAPQTRPSRASPSCAPSGGTRCELPSPRAVFGGDRGAEKWSGASPDVGGEQLMDETLIADPRASCLDTQGAQDVGVDANRDQLAGRAPERRPANPPRASQLLVGQPG